MWWDLGVNVKRYHVAETIETTREHTLPFCDLGTWEECFLMSSTRQTPKQKHRGERSS